MTLRPYQVEAIRAIHRELAANRSTLLVMATGTGKTSTFSDIARTWDDRRVLVLAHRDELLTQARKRLEADTGEAVDLEQAGWSSYSARIVVGSVQSLHDARLRRFSPDAFGLIVIDEAHRGVAKSYRAILDYFASAKVLGVTATPDRTDESAMGQIFDSVAYRYDIADAIRDGWLCPITARKVVIDELRLDAIKTTAGDLNQGQLDDEMAKHVHAIAKPLADGIGGVDSRKTLVFATSISTSRAIAAALNGYRHGCARAIDSQMEMDDRRETLRAYKRGDFQFLVNVMVLTEGFDEPSIECVAIARPTKSRLLFTQMAGRGTRTHEGKRDLLLLHFTGATTRHRLACPADILSGRWPEDVIARAGDGDLEESLKKSAEDIAREAAERMESERARAQEAARRMAVVRARTEDVSAWSGWMGNDDSGSLHGEPATDAQMDFLRRAYAKAKKPLPADMTKRQAARLIGETQRRRREGLASIPQANVLRRYGLPADCKREQAKALMDALASNRWQALPRSTVDHILGGDR